MKKFFLLSWLLSFIFSSLYSQTVYKSYKDGELYLKLKNNVAFELPDFVGKNATQYPEIFQPLIQQYGIYSIKKAFPHLKTVELEHTYKILFTEKEKANALISDFQKIELIEYAERVPLYHTFLTPNDPSYGNQYALTKISAPNAWNLTTGNHNVKVAIVDNAVMINHTDLTANKWINSGEVAGNGVDDDGDGYVDDVNGYDVADGDNNPNPPSSASPTNFEHGTHCAGIADAVGNNSTGVASIGFNLSLIGVKCEPDNSSNPDEISYAMEGVEYAIAAHANVVSMSWGGGGFSQAEQNVFTAGWNQGVIFCAAAGNDGMDEAEYPAQYTHVIAVGATTSTDAIASFSNYGAWIGVMAPGNNIYSTLPNTNGGSTYGNLSGTSMATPLVAGLCGLMKAYSPASTNAQIVSCLESSCDNINSQNPSYAGELGSGRINAYAALNCLVSAPTANFSADVTSTCSGVVHFTDLTAGTPTSWSWTFGDGGVSTLQNPVHEYTTNGTYTVVLTATNNLGSNTKTQTNYITVNKPAAPTVTGGSRCGAGTVSLSATVANGDSVKWYSSATGDTVVSVANPFTTPSINSTTTYYAEEIVTGATSSVGPAAQTTLGSGGYFSNSTDHYLIFNVLAPCTLKSVAVYAQNAGSRTIALRDASGTTIQSATVTLVTGINTVTLNFPLSVGTSFELGINGTANLYRNNAVTSGFPFSNTYVSITGSDPGTGYYYYFYNWQIKAADCISLRAPATATVNPVPTATAAATNGSCSGGSSSINLTVSGGTPAYTYHWNDGITTQNRTGIAAGTYTVTITDAHSCSATSSATVAQSGGTPLSVSGSATNISCNGGNNGTINITASGGTGSYTYSWGNGVASQNRTGLTAGTYTVTVTDANSCSATFSSSLTQPTAITTSVTTSNASCGAQNGSATANVSGGTPSYSYLWNNGQTTSALSNVGAGNYSVTVTDNHTCTASSSAFVNNTSSITASSSVTNATCFGRANGSIALTVNNAAQPISYSWSNGNSSASPANLAAGNYTVTITDGAGCISTLTASVSQPTAITISITPTAATCNSNNGNVLLNVSGGNPTYIYAWSNGETSALATNLSAGNYSVTVTDSHTCTATSSVTIASSPSVTATASSTNANCFGSSDGSALVNITSGTSPYSYLWSNGVSSSTVTNLSAGNYSVTVRDANSCSATSSVTVSQPSEIQTLASVTNATTGASNGSASVSPSGGTAPYTIQWSNGGNGTNLAAGTYSYTVTDANNCTQTGSVTINETATGINETSGEISFSVFPNPASNEVTITIDNINTKTILNLKNVLGQTLIAKEISSTVTTLDLSSFASGVYIIELNREDVKAAKRLVISK